MSEPIVYAPILTTSGTYVLNEPAFQIPVPSEMQYYVLPESPFAGRTFEICNPMATRGVNQTTLANEPQ
jgi:hypothetical protein